MKDINEIDWQKLSASDVPRWLSDLASEDRPNKQLTESYNQFYNFLSPNNESVQDRLKMMESDVSYEIVPFLISILENAKHPSKIGSTLELLELLARRWLSRVDFSETNPNRSRWELWSRRVNDAVRQGIPTYQRLLTSTYSSVKENAQALLDVLEQTQV